MTVSGPPHAAHGPAGARGVGAPHRPQAAGPVEAAAATRPRTLLAMARRPARTRPGAVFAHLFGDGSDGSRAQFRQARWVIGLTLLCGAMSAAHLGTPARAVWAVGGLAGAYVAMRRSPWLLLTWTFWLWTLTPLIRRLAEWHSGFNGHDPLLALPAVSVMFMVPDVIRSRSLSRSRTVVAGLGIMLPIAYGFGDSLVRGDVEAAAFAAADWIIPLVYYFFIAANRHRSDEIAGHLKAFIAVSTLVIVPYSLYQFLFMTPWDELWLANSGLVAVDQITNPTQNRVFGTLNNAGFLALWVGWSLLMMGFYATPITIVLGPIGLFLLIVTLSRSVYISTFLGFLTLLAAAPPRNILKQGAVALFGIVVVVGLISVLNPDVATDVSDRFGSILNPAHDTSANVRKGIWEQTPAMIADQPFGEGIGAIGRSADLNAGGGQSVVDSGVLGPYLAFGWVFGSLYLFSMITMTGLALRSARKARSREAAAAAAAAVVIVAILPFLTVDGFPATMLWTSLAIAAERSDRVLALRRRARRRTALLPETLNA